MKSDWKKEMDKLYKLTARNWHKTGKNKKAKGISGNISLGVEKLKQFLTLFFNVV